jgi:hypothetical protein
MSYLFVVAYARQFRPRTGANPASAEMPPACGAAGDANDDAGEDA